MSKNQRFVVLAAALALLVFASAGKPKPGTGPEQKLSALVSSAQVTKAALGSVGKAKSKTSQLKTSFSQLHSSLTALVAGWKKLPKGSISKQLLDNIDEFRSDCADQLLMSTDSLTASQLKILAAAPDASSTKGPADALNDMADQLHEESVAAQQQQQHNTTQTCRKTVCARTYAGAVIKAQAECALPLHETQCEFELNAAPPIPVVCGKTVLGKNKYSHKCRVYR